MAVTDLATWITVGVAAAAAVTWGYFSWRAQRARREAVVLERRTGGSARKSAESVDKAQRVRCGPALHVEWDQRATEGVGVAPVLLACRVRNTGDDTALIEGVRVLERGNLRLEFRDTRGNKEKILKQFDVGIWQCLLGVRLESTSARLTIPDLTDNDRALKVGATRTLLVLTIERTHALRICEKIRAHVDVQLIYRSTAAIGFDTEHRVADLRRALGSGPT
jgi:hypothetical protein